MRLVVCFMVLWALVIGAAAQQQILVPTRPPGDSSNAAASTAFVTGAIATGPSVPGGTLRCNPVGSAAGPAKNCSYPIANVVDFGVAGNGVTNDAPAINNAIAAAAGGIVVFPNGLNYAIAAQLSIGNGTSSSVSTVQGTVLLGLGNPTTLAAAFGPFNQSTGPVLSWIGSAGPANMVSIRGPLMGWGVNNLQFNCNSTAAVTGLQVQSGQFGDSTNNTFIHCVNSISSQTYAHFDSITVTDSFHNYFRNTNILMPGIVGSIGILLTGGGAGVTNSDTDFNTFINTSILVAGTAATQMYAIYLQQCDDNTFYSTHIYGGNSSSVGVQFDYTVTSTWPSNNSFYGIDTGNTNGAGSWVNNGSPGASATANYVMGLDDGNGGSCPNVGNLTAYCGHQINMSAGGTSANAFLSASASGWALSGSSASGLSLGFNGGTSGALTLQGSTSGSSTITVSATGAPQYGGTPSNAAAPAGDIGEIITASQTTPQNLTAGTAINTTSISLTAGDWDVNGICQFPNVNNISSTTAYAQFICSISTTSATADGTDLRDANFFLATTATAPAGIPRFVVGTSQFSLNATTTVFLVSEYAGGGTITFGSGTNIQATGTIRARRMHKRRGRRNGATPGRVTDRQLKIYRLHRLRKDEHKGRQAKFA